MRESAQQIKTYHRYKFALNSISVGGLVTCTSFSSNIKNNFSVHTVHRIIVHRIGKWTEELPPIRVVGGDPREGAVGKSSYIVYQKKASGVCAKVKYYS